MNCLHCNKEFIKKVHNAIYCSKSCVRKVYYENLSKGNKLEIEQYG